MRYRLRYHLVWLLLILIAANNSKSVAQGFDHQWLLGSLIQLTDTKGRAFIDSSSFKIYSEFRNMPFWGTQGNISDVNGNLLMYCNGIWIANADGDTMMNGGGLNPNGQTSSWPFGMPTFSNNLIIPFPGDSNKYVMLHHTWEMVGSSTHVTELYSSTIDMLGDSGRGEVTIKNNVVYSDTMGFGVAACKHGNGRDWWAVMQRENTDEFNVFLCDPHGISFIGTEHFSYTPLPRDNGAQHTFSQAGDMFLTTTFRNDNGITTAKAVLADFDRCTGSFSNIRQKLISTNTFIWGLAFSASGEFAYVCTENYIFQINTNTFTLDTVAVYDGFISPPPFTCCATTFWNLYLAADNKIYVTSGSGVKHLTVINHPDSAGLACDVQQHSIELPGIWLYLRSVPSHPNYYLSALQGSPCDTITSVNEKETALLEYSISPNPNTGSFTVKYSLPGGIAGRIEVSDMLGRLCYSTAVDPLGNQQEIETDLRSGIYICSLRAGERVLSKKIIIR